MLQWRNPKVASVKVANWQKKLESVKLFTS